MGREISIRDLTYKIAAMTGFKGSFKWRHDMPNGQPRRSLDITRAREILSWEPRTDRRDGLLKTIEYFRQR